MNLFDQVKTILVITGIYKPMGLVFAVNLVLYVAWMFCPRCGHRWKNLHGLYHYCPNCGYNTINYQTLEEQLENCSPDERK